MKKTCIVLSLILIFASFEIFPQSLNRKNISIPDIPGYKTLKCDFHIHTVFSDGNVWPTTRIDEAWMDGLDAIAITDHLEYRPHDEYLKTSHNASYKIASGKAKNLGITLIHGSEITRSMPPGHMNALFITDSDSLIKEDWKAVALEVKRQGGIIVWNHPGWVAQQPDGIGKWYKEHDFLIENDVLKGIEIINETTYYPEVFRWCIDKNLTIFGNTDIHDPIVWEYPPANGIRRTMNLVFAKSNTSDDIKEAMCAHRTAVWSNNNLYGKEEFLLPIFERSVTQSTADLSLKGKGRAYVQLRNSSHISYDFELADTIKSVKFPKAFKIGPNETANISIQGAGDSNKWSGTYDVKYRVKNIFTAPGENLIVKLRFNINIKPDKE